MKEGLRPSLTPCLAGLSLLSRQQVAQVYFTEVAESYRQGIGGIAWLGCLR